MIETAHQHRTSWRHFWRHLFSFIFTRGFFVGSLLLLEIFLFWYYTTNIFNYNLGVHVLFQIFSILVVTYVVSTNTQPLYKLAWVT
ncbi:hypothetical protein IJJ27_04410, partial [bacterium]|nr:hypothetical protein [bacterium]